MEETQSSLFSTVVVVVIFGFFAFLILVGIIKNIAEYRENMEDLKRMMYHADDREEYLHWKREIRIYRLSIITGLTPNRIDKIRRALRRKNKKK